MTGNKAQHLNIFKNPRVFVIFLMIVHLLNEEAKNPVIIAPPSSNAAYSGNDKIRKIRINDAIEIIFKIFLSIGLNQ